MQTHDRPEIIEKVHRGEAYLGNLLVGDTIVGAAERGYRLVDRIMIDEAYRILLLRAPSALVGSDKDFRVADMTPAMLQECQKFRRVWRSGLAFVIGVDCVTMTVTVVARAGDEFSIRARRIGGRARDDGAKSADGK